MRRKDLRDRYVQAMREHSARPSSKDREVHALDLDVHPPVRKGWEHMWEKGDLLDSLDLSSTKLKDALMSQPHREQPQQDSTEDNFEQRTNQHKLPMPAALQAHAQEYEDEIRSVLSADHVPRRPGKVADIRARVREQRMTEDAACSAQLRQLSSEEQKMLESLSRLDSKLSRLQIPDGSIDYVSKPRPKRLSPDQEEAMLLSSVARLTDILEKRSEAATDVGSVISVPLAPAIRSIAYLERKVARVTVADLRRERTQSAERPAVKRIGAVYNEVAAVSGRYNADNPPPPVALKKPKEREPLSFRKPPIARPKYTNLVVVNPRVDLKSLFKNSEAELPQWAIS